jgi:hypothetical protein
MDVSDQAIYYTHQASDSDHTSVDNVAIVLRNNETSYDLVVFPVGGPVQFVSRVKEFDADGPVYVAGDSYVREAGSEPPDFSAFEYSNDADWIALRRKQQAELEAIPGYDEEGIAHTRERHKREQADLDGRLAKKYKRDEQPKGAQENA